MTPSTLAPEEMTVDLPNHLELPCTDGSILTSTQEHPQSDMFTQLMTPRLEEIHPDKQYCVGCDVGIYFRAVKPPLAGCKSPDWWYVPGVPPMLDGEYRRSYVMYYEMIRPLLLIEYVSGDGSEERDTTPETGKFWVYERAIASPITRSTSPGRIRSRFTTWWTVGISCSRPTRRGAFRSRRCGSSWGSGRELFAT